MRGYQRVCRVMMVLCLMVLVPWSAVAVQAPCRDAGSFQIPAEGQGTRALPSFTNVSDISGLSGLGGSFFSWGDFNSDGYPDLIVNGQKLYENSGPPGFTFTDVTAAKGISASGKGVWGDYDNDGDLDLFVANWNDKLYQNQGPPNYDFVDVTVAAGNVGDTHPGTAASWGDLDKDGDLDLYIVNGEVWDPYQHFPDTLWSNNGDGTFTNITTQAGVDTSSVPYYGRGAIWGDYDNDGWQDLYVSNYRLQYNYLYYNNRNGTFDQRSKELNAAGFGRTGTGAPGDRYFGHTIGSSFADLNNDGWLDIFVANLVHKDPDRGRYCDDSNIYMNNGYPYWNFTDIRSTSGIPIKPVKGTTHGYYDDENFANAAIADFDNDGYMDVYIPQVYKFSWMYSYLYHNNGNSTWTNVSDVLGLHNVVDTYGGAWADYDSDGDMDLVTAGRQNQWNQTDITTPVNIRLYRNEGGSNHYLKVNLTGVLSNRNGVGAKVYLKVGTELLMQQVETGMGSHGQQNDMRLHFGLGTATQVDRLEVVWPSGIIQVQTNVAADQQLEIEEDTSGPRITSVSASTSSTTPDNDVTVQGQVSGTIGSYGWDFEGDMAYDWTGTSNQARTFTVRGAWEYHPTFRAMDPSGDLGFFMTTKVKVENVPPVADAGEDVLAIEDDVVTFDGSASADTLWDRANLTYQYFFGDDTNSSPVMDPTADHVYTKAGTYEVTLVVQDPLGEMSEDKVQVEVQNAVPTVALAGNSTVLEDVELVLNATGNDTVSDLVEGLEFRWDFDDGTVTDWSQDNVAAHTFTASGERNVTVWVRDDDDSTASQNKTVTVVNLPPEVSVDIVSFAIDEDGVVTLSGTGSDTPSDMSAGLEFKWDFGDGNSTSWGTTSEVSHTYTYSGDFTAMLLVRDIDGVEVNGTASVKVYNVPPAGQVTEAPTELLEDEVGHFTGLGIDTPSDQVSLRYKWDFGDGNNTGWMDVAEADHTYNISGEFQVWFSVVDNDGDEYSMDTMVTVLNVAPTGEVISPDVTGFDEDTTVRFEGNGTDTASDLEGLDFSWAIGGAVVQGKVVEHTFASKGTYKVTFTVTDDDGATATQDLDIRIANVPPSVTIDKDAVTLKVGDGLDLNATIEETPTDLAKLEIEWDGGLGNTLTGQGTTNVTVVFMSSGVFDVKVTVKDDDGERASDTVRVTVQPKKGGGGGGDGMDVWALYAGAGGLVAIVVVVLVVLLLMRARKRDGPEEPDDDEGHEPPSEEE